MKIGFLSPAAAEYRDAVDYYEAVSTGLGAEFADEIALSLQRIAAYPDAWPKLSVRTRRCMMNRFPYGLVYRTRGKEIQIIAIMHLKQNPLYWRDRLR